MAHDSEDFAWARHVRAGVYQRVSKLAGAHDRKEIERARSIEEQNKANQDDPALGARSLPYGPVPHR
jgi:hypothetical protein